MDFVLSLIKNQTSCAVDRLYGLGPSSHCHWTVRSIFQALDPIEKTILMRLFFVDKRVYCNEILEWFKQEGRQKCNESLNNLSDLRIIKIIDIEDKRVVVFNEFFRESLKFSLSSLTEPWAHPSGIEIAEITPEILDTRSNEKWEKVLYFLLSGNPDCNIPGPVKEFLIQAGIMSRNSNTWTLTKNGYDYMLKDFSSQVSLCILETFYKISFITPLGVDFCYDYAEY